MCQENSESIENSYFLEVVNGLRESEDTSGGGARNVSRI